MTPQTKGEPGSDNAADYRHIALVRFHELLRRGYARLDRAVCRKAPEEHISGDLADAIDDVLDERSDPWMDSFSVHNEPPVRDPQRKGKHRRKVDIRIDSALGRPRTRFAFEAKRLGNGHGVPQYLGEDGLGRFLRGEYARTEDMAGMMGYVQSAAVGDWAAKIGGTLDASADDYRVLKGRNWQHTPLVGGLEHTYRSTHSREHVHRPIDIYHSLLDFS